MSLAIRMRRTPIAAYFILACAVTWIAVAPLVAAWLGLLAPIAPAWHWVGALGPVTAAVVVTGVGEGRDGLRAWWSGMTRWRTGLVWWVLAVGSPFALFVLAALLLHTLGRPWPSMGPLGASLAEPGWVANLVAASVAYGFGEEPGWRGFALPRLQAGRGALQATLILTVLWAFWHAPFFTYRYDLGGLGAYVGFFVCLAAGALWLTFLYNSSQGSVLLVIVWHTAWNVLNVAAAPVSGELVMVANVLVIPLGLVALAIGGPRRLSCSEKHVIGQIRPVFPNALHSARV